MGQKHKKRRAFRDDLYGLARQGILGVSVVGYESKDGRRQSWKEYRYIQ